MHGRSGAAATIAISAPVLGRTSQPQMQLQLRLQQRQRHGDAKGIISVDNYAQVDVARAERTGFPEVVFGEGKTAVQIAEIFATLAKSAPDKATLASRVSSEKWQEIQPVLEACGLSNVEYHAQARMVVYKPGNPAQSTSKQHNLKPCVVAAGTSDLPVAEEACVTLDASGYPPTRVYDVGVAGIHRLFAKLDEIRSADVVIVVAGMDGALPSVVTWSWQILYLRFVLDIRPFFSVLGLCCCVYQVAGLVDRPVIAVPTSVGYGAAFQGVSPLLTMLNSCSPGVTVVNIDNGFGAAASCVKIFHRIESQLNSLQNAARAAL